MGLLDIVFVVVAFWALIKAERLDGEIKMLRQEVEWLHKGIARTERDAIGDPVVEPDAVGDGVHEVTRRDFVRGVGGPSEPPVERGPSAEEAVTPGVVTGEPAQQGEPLPEVAPVLQTTAGEKKAARVNLEARIGGTWLLRIGLGILAISLALYASTVVPLLSPAAKVALAYAGASAFFGIGRFFAARLQKFARPVMAAGLSFGFFVAFAAHFVPAMQAVSLPVSIVWMLASMVTVLIAAERWQSELTAGLAILLGQISAYVSAGQADGYSLVIIGFLALTAVLLLLRHRWVVLGVFAVVATYGSHLLVLSFGQDPPSGDEGFWINLGFLTSYYVVFLIADVLWWRRNDERPSESLDSVRVKSARQLGPTNLVLYVSLTTIVFVASGAGFETIEWYFLTLGALQGGLAWFYRRVNHSDFVYYPAFGSVLLTLGFFATLDALALNLVLSSQALLMLIAAHRTRLWIFHGLAQAALLVAFIHYLAFPPPALVTWAVFLGGLGVASVYLLKASLEEIWYGDGDPAEVLGARDTGLAGLFMGFLAPLAPKLSLLHGVMGGFVLVGQASQYFGRDPSLLIFLSTVALVLVATALARGRVALLYAVAMIAVSDPYFALVIPDVMGTLLLLGALVTSTLVLVHLAASRFGESEARVVAWLSYFIVASVLIGAITALFANAVEFPGHLLWLALPVLLLVFLEHAGVALQPLTAAAPKDVAEGYQAVARIMYLLVSALVILLTVQAVGTVIAAPIWVAGWATVIFMASGIRRSRSLFITGYVVLLGGYQYFLVMQPGAADLFSTLWLGFFVPSDLGGLVLSTWWAGLIITIVPLVLALGIDRQIHAPDSRGSGAVRGADALAYLTYGVGFLLLAAFSAHQLPAGWSLLAPAVVGLGLAWRFENLGTPRAVPAVAVGMALLHTYFLLRTAGGLDAEDLLWPLALLVTVTFALERLVPRWATKEGDHPLGRPGQSVLVAFGALTAMVAIYESSLFGAAWATAGWSILAGLMMAAGFAFKSSSQRRVALVVLATCVGRVFYVDMRGLGDTARTGAFFVLGLSLVGIAWLYTRYSEELKNWL